MSQRPSNPSVSSAPAIGNGYFVPPSDKKPTWEHGSRSASHSRFPNTDSLDPDELFTKHGVFEVKFIQQRLRADADAKQEELRLMVGERYRDLLQASTAIISIAQSSQRVKQALQETRDGILSQEEPRATQRYSSLGGGASDAHLQTLQLLSAHMKLLLDAPEHLWRLIERKRFLPAAWLFLLARVVYRALIREDEQDEGSWSRQGVDVLSQFPLVQRQWDAISQFRPQVVHKATVSLREENSTVEDACATLLTLHLLDSQPLSGTLSVYLTQRSKTLQSKLSWNRATGNPDLLNHKANGHSAKQSQPEAIPSGKAISEIRELTLAALQIISRTIQAAQKIFQDVEGKSPSLIRNVLQYIQSETSTPPEHARPLSADLYLTTPSLLAKLPSSTHFQLLPPNLRSYRPHVDLTSSSTLIHYAHSRQEIEDWFRQAILLFQSALSRWFIELQTVKAVWSVRLSTRGWILGSGLDREEVIRMTDVLDGACRHRVLEIWRLRLRESFQSFVHQLDSTVLFLNRSSGAQKLETSRVNFLFQAPPLPTASHSKHGSINASFQNYKTSLRRQIVGRTSSLNDLLATIESCARTIRRDLTHVMTGGNETRDLVERLEVDYRPDADTLCKKVTDKLEQVTKSPADAPLSTNALVFLDHVSDELASSSPFLSDIGCQPSSIEGFRERLIAVRDGIVDRWRSNTVSRIVQEHRLGCHTSHHVLTKTPIPSCPSSNLIRSLLSLSISIQERNRSYNRPQEEYLVQATLNQFITELIGDGWIDEGARSLCDLAFLRKLLTLGGAGCSDTNQLWVVLKKRIQQNLPGDLRQEELDQAASESIVRMQNLFGTLLPHHPSITPSDGAKSSLLPYGLPPPSELQFQSAIELAKPTPRFGLLLVT